MYYVLHNVGIYKQSFICYALSKLSWALRKYLKTLFSFKIVSAFLNANIISLE